MSTLTHVVRGATVALLFGGLTTTGADTANAVASTAPLRAHTLTRNALSVTVSTRIAFEPANVVVRVGLNPDADNRALEIEWWSATGSSGSHLVPMDGDRAAGHYEFVLKNLASGDYTVAAVLKRSNRTEIRRDARVVVLGGPNS